MGASHLIGVSTTGNWTYSTPNLVVLRTTTFFPYSMQYHGTNVGNFMKYSTRYLVLIMPQYCSSSHGIFYSSICQATCSQQIQSVFHPVTLNSYSIVIQYRKTLSFQHNYRRFMYCRPVLNVIHVTVQQYPRVVILRNRRTHAHTHAHN